MSDARLTPREAILALGVARDRIADLEAERDYNRRAHDSAVEYNAKLTKRLRETEAQLTAAVLAEREACAHLAVDWLDGSVKPSVDNIRSHIAAAIGSIAELRGQLGKLTALFADPAP